MVLFGDLMVELRLLGSGCCSVVEVESGGMKLRDREDESCFREKAREPSRYNRESFTG